MIHSKSVYMPVDPVNDGHRILIMRFIPRTFIEARNKAEEAGEVFDQPWNIWIPDLAPSPRLLAAFRNKEMHFVDFVARYLREISSDQGVFLLKGTTTLALMGNVALLCCEQHDTYCHRRLVRDIIIAIMQRSQYNLQRVWGLTDVPQIIAEYGKNYKRRVNVSEQNTQQGHANETRDATREETPN